MVSGTSAVTRVFGHSAVGYLSAGKADGRVVAAWSLAAMELTRSTVPVPGVEVRRLPAHPGRGYGIQPCEVSRWHQRLPLGKRQNTHLVMLSAVERDVADLVAGEASAVEDAAHGGVGSASAWQPEHAG